MPKPDMVICVVESEDKLVQQWTAHLQQIDFVREKMSFTWHFL